MSGAVTALLLALTVAAVWVACLALLRLPRALDRMHAAAFLNAAAAILVTLVGFAADGISGRSLKIAVMMAVLVLSGAVLSHAVGRAVLMREGPDA